MVAVLMIWNCSKVFKSLITLLICCKLPWAVLVASEVQAIKQNKYKINRSSNMYTMLCIHLLSHSLPLGRQPVYEGKKHLWNSFLHRSKWVCCRIMGALWAVGNLSNVSWTGSWIPKPMKLVLSAQEALHLFGCISSSLCHCTGSKEVSKAICVTWLEYKLIKDIFLKKQILSGHAQDTFCETV